MCQGSSALGGLGGVSCSCACDLKLKQNAGVCMYVHMYNATLSDIVLYKCVLYHMSLASVILCCTSAYYTICGWPQ